MIDSKQLPSLLPSTPPAASFDGAGRFQHFLSVATIDTR